MNQLRVRSAALGLMLLSCMAAKAGDQWDFVSGPFPAEYKHPSVMTGAGTGSHFESVVAYSAGYGVSMYSDLTGRWLLGDLVYYGQTDDGRQNERRFMGLVAVDANTSAVKFIQVHVGAADRALLEQVRVVRTTPDALVVEFSSWNGELAPRTFEFQFRESRSGDFDVKIAPNEVGALVDSERFHYAWGGRPKDRELRITDRHSTSTTTVHAREFFTGREQPTVFRSGYKYLLEPGAGGDGVLVVPVPLDEQPTDLLVAMNPNAEHGVAWRVTADDVHELLASSEVLHVRPAWSMAVRPRIAVIAIDYERTTDYIEFERSAVCVAVDITTGNIVHAWKIPGWLGFGRPVIASDESVVCVETEDPENYDHMVGLYSIATGERTFERDDLYEYQEPVAIRDTDTGSPEVIVADGAEVWAASFGNRDEPRVIFTLFPEE
jgi:hypothetical protein